MLVARAGARKSAWGSSGGAILDARGGRFGALGAVSDRSWELGGPLGRILAALGAVLDRSWELLAPLGAILGAPGPETLVL